MMLDYEVVKRTNNNFESDLESALSSVPRRRPS